MKKIVCLLAAVAALLCACGKREISNIYHVERYGRTYIVDQEARTVAYQDVVYTFETASGGGSGYSITFTAPDGSTAYWQESGNLGHGGWSDDWDGNVSPGDLADAVANSASPPRQRSGNPLAGLLLIALGAFQALAPKAVWYLRHGWVYKDAEPSELALGFGRIVGGAVVLIGIICCLV